MVYILLHLVNIISIALGWHLDKGLYFDGVGGTSMNLSFFWYDHDVSFFI